MTKILMLGLVAIIVCITVFACGCTTYSSESTGGASPDACATVCSQFNMSFYKYYSGLYAPDECWCLYEGKPFSIGPL